MIGVPMMNADVGISERSRAESLEVGLCCLQLMVNTWLGTYSRRASDGFEVFGGSVVRRSSVLLDVHALPSLLRLDISLFNRESRSVYGFQ